MTSSISFLNRVALLVLLGGGIALPGCGSVSWSSLVHGGGQALPGAAESGPSETRTAPIAVFPFENLSGSRVDLKSIRASFIEALRQRGIPILGEDALERFMVRNRVRYTAGIDARTAQALKAQTGAEGVVMTSVEFSSEAIPPKIALTSRLVSTGDAPAIMWVDGVGLAGDDHPGILDLGQIRDAKALRAKALGALSASLAGQLSGPGKGHVERAAGKFRPKIAYLSPDLGAKKKYTVAVAPFFNKSERRYAGEMLVLQFIRGLHGLGEFDVIEPGLVRQAFLGLRIIMDQGVSLSDANALFAVLDADLVLGGEVFDYQDYQGGYGTAKVHFTAQLIERKSQKVVWSSESYNRGDDGVFFFDLGKVTTAHVMTAGMVRSIGNILVKR
jgi:TolB-like protein